MVDRYTKLVLTIIAISLSAIAMKMALSTPATAQSGSAHVIVDSISPGAFLLPVPVRVSQ